MMDIGVEPRFINLILILSVLILLILPTTTALIPFQNRTWPDRVYDGQAKFPTYADIGRLINEIDGKYVSPLDPGYINASRTHNLRVMRTPALIVYPVNSKDIQTVVNFAKSRNIHLSIRSSGHSYIGRSTHGGGIVLSMELMRSVDISLTSSRSPAGEVRVQSGASWIEVFKEVDKVVGPDQAGNKVGRVVVGGSAHSVAMGGYTQGGGHAPICRKLGLAVDNLLEATIVTADGNLLTLSKDKTIVQDINGTKRESDDTSLFWAIRGGGGGTWGVVVSFTYKLHFAPERFRDVVLFYPLYSSTSGKRVYESSVKKVLSDVNKLSEDWGGYVVILPGPVPQTTFYDLLLVSLIHYGNDSSPSNHEVDDIISKTNPISKSDTNFPTFLQYEVTAKDPEYYNTYIANTFVQPTSISDPSNLDKYTDFLYNQVKDGIACTMTLIGGKVIQSNPRPATPIHPGFRNGIFSASCGLGWAYNPVEDAKNSRKALNMAEILYTFGDGSYFNEPAEDMPDWKVRFWKDSSTYNSLLAIKKKYDSDNYFWCHNCVASDLGTKYGPPVNYDNDQLKIDDGNNFLKPATKIGMHPTVFRARL